jgi:5-methylcytosine-specific restriction protein A
MAIISIPLQQRMDGKGEHMAWDHSDKTTTERGYGVEHQRIREELKRTVILCEECARQGRTSVGKIADHIKPLAKGGSGDRSNYQWLCQACADEKDAVDRGASPPRKRPTIGSDGWPITWGGI